MNTFTFLLGPLGALWNTVFYYPVVNLIILIYKTTGFNFGLAIILLTILVRLLLWPFMKTQIDSLKKMQSIKPELDKVKEKYKDDKMKYQEEQLRLYRENGVNPAGSCLPLLVQLPFIYAVYNVIRTISSSKNAAVFNHIVYVKWLQMSAHTKFQVNFLSLNLSKDAKIVGFHSFQAILPYLLLALLVGITQFFASKVSLPTNTADITETVEILEEPKSKKKKMSMSVVKEEKKADDSIDPEQFSKMLSTQMLYLFPLILVWISLGFTGSIPSGLSVYWVVQSFVVVIQTMILQGKFNIKGFKELTKVWPPNK